MPEATDASVSSRPWGTLSVSLACTLAFLVSWAASGFVLWDDAGRLDAELLRSYGALDWLKLREDSQWWRLASAPLLHGAWWHLAFNLWALFVLGGSVEREFGRARWGVVLLASGLCSGLAAMAWGRADMVVGVSGVVFGYGGFLLGSAVRAKFGSPVNERAEGTQGSNSRLSNSGRAVDPARFSVSIRELSFWLGLSIAAGWVWPELSQAGHVGGLAAGLVCGLAGSSGVGVSAAVAVLVTGSAVAGDAVTREVESPEALERLGYALLNQDRAADAWPVFDRALSQVEGKDSRRGEWLNAAAYARAVGADNRDEWEAAVELVRESLSLEPENPNRLDTLGWLQCRLGEVDAGLLTLRKAESLSEGEPSEELAEHIDGCQLR